MPLFGNLFGQLFGDSASEFEARGDQFAGVNNWRRAYEEYQRAVQKTARSSPGYRRLAAKLDEARSQSFDTLLEDIHSRIDVREFTYAAEQIELARRMVETSQQLARVEECESRLHGAGRYEPRATAAGQTTSSTGDEQTPGAAAARFDRGAGESAWPGPAPAGRRSAAGPGSELADLEASNPDQDFRRLLDGMSARAVEDRVKLGPRYRDAALALASGRPERAVGLLEDLQHDNPASPVLLYDLAAALQAAGRKREAQVLYARRMQEAPEDWQAWYELAQALWRDGSGDRALQTIRSGLERHPRSGHLMAQWGVFLHKLGDPRQALEKFYLALQLDAFDDTGLYHTIANLHLELGEEEKARRGYLKALELDRQSVGTMLDYAEFLIEKKQDARAALAILDTAYRAIRTGAGQPLHQVYASYLSSRAHMMLGEREMALLAVTRALEDNGEAWLAETLESQRQAVLSV
ncbi:MAG: tetratricopeptide repeat protein [Candidatus Krumholzibacteriia bacterium]